MSDDQAMADEFMAEVNDKYYPQVMDGIERIEAGDLEAGLEAVGRPLHTIKGVTGFISGFGDASVFTHKVEDFLKKLKSGEVEPSPGATDLASRAVTQVFAVLEQVHSFGSLDQGEAGAILEELEGFSAGGDLPGVEAEAGPALEILGDALVLSVGMRRVNTPGQRLSMAQALAGVPDGKRVLLDLGGVLSMNSSAWEEVRSHAHRLALAATGMAPAVMEVYYAWEFDKDIARCGGREAFAAGPGKGADG